MSNFIHQVVHNYEQCDSYEDAGYVLIADVRTKSDPACFDDSSRIRFKTTYKRGHGLLLDWIDARGMRSKLLFDESGGTRAFVVGKSFRYERLIDGIAAMVGASYGISVWIPSLLMPNELKALWTCWDKGFQKKRDQVEQSLEELEWDDPQRSIELIVEKNSLFIRIIYVVEKTSAGFQHIQYVFERVTVGQVTSHLFESKVKTLDELPQAGQTLEHHTLSLLQEWSKLPDPSWPNDRKTCVICEKSVCLRAGLRVMVGPKLVVTGEAARGDEGLSLIKHEQPDFVIVGPEMEGMACVDFVAEVRSTLPRTRILLIATMYTATSQFHQFLRSGVNGIVLLGAGGQELCNCIDFVTAGKAYIQGRLLSVVEPDPQLSARYHLNPVELQVLIRISQSDAMIDRELNLGERQLRKVINSVLRKVGAQSKTRASLISLELGYTELPILPGRSPQSGIDLERDAGEKSSIESILKHKLKNYLSTQDSL